MLRNLKRQRDAGTICGIARTGVRASEIPDDGDSPSLLLNDVLETDPPDAEYSTEVADRSFVGTLDGPDEYGRFTYTPPPGYIGSVTINQHVRVYTPTGLLREYDEVISADFGNAAWADLTVSYSLNGQVSADLPISYSINAYVYADAGVSYNLLTPVYTDLNTTYNVNTFASVDLGSAYAVGGIVWADLHLSYRILDNTAPHATAAATGYLPPRPAPVVGIRVGY